MKPQRQNKQNLVFGHTNSLKQSTKAAVILLRNNFPLNSSIFKQQLMYILRPKPKCADSIYTDCMCSLYYLVVMTIEGSSAKMV